MRVLLADDEPIALERLEIALSCVPEAILVASAKTGKEALTLIKELKPDVAVLDVQMPMRDGFGVMEGLRAADRLPEVIFVTAFPDYAIRAFDLQAVDYLLKPVAFERFREALRRAKVRLTARSNDDRFAELQRLLESASTERPSSANALARDLWVQERGGLTKITASAIDRIEAEGDYVRIHVGDASHLFKDTIAAMIDRLDPSLFARVHRSSIVNLTRVRTVRRRTPRGMLLILAGGTTVAIGPTFVEDVMQRLHARRWRASPS